MKQKFVFLIILIFSLFLQACSQINQPADMPTATATVAKPAATSAPFSFRAFECLR